MRAANAEQSIFLAALELQTPAEREAYLKGACGADAAMLSNVQGLLVVHEEGDDFLEHPPLDATTNELPVARPGTRIGPYNLLEQIGEGGMGLVFVAEQQKPVRRKVALKLIKPGMDSRQVIARFEAERQALAMMDHPNIAKVHDGGATAEGRPYFVMELVKGTPITDYCDRNQLGTRQRLELFLDVCQAVQHAHQKGIIHRDLKPSNILVEVHDVRPVVKIIDFGIAKAIGQQLTDKTMYTGIAQMIGTPLYMSPEQAGLSSLDVDTRSDVYALGVLLYELLTGTTPFDNETLKKAGYDEMRRIIRDEDPPKPSTRLSTLGQLGTTASERRQSDPRRLSKLFRGELDWIVMKALEKDRNRRYETASAFAADVERHLRNEPVEARPASVRYKLGKLALRNKSRLSIAAIMLVSVLAVAGTIAWMARDRAVQQTQIEQAVREDLRETDIWQNQQQWVKAIESLNRAEARLGSCSLETVRSKIAKRRDEILLVIKLEEAQLKASDVASEANHGSSPHYTGPRGLFIRTKLQRDYAGADRAYEKAFAEYGLNVNELAPDEIARRIRGSVVAAQLVPALDFWAFFRGRVAQRNGESLRAIARKADSDPWREMLRQPEVAQNRQKLESLAVSESVLQQPSANLLILSYLLENVNSLSSAIDLLRRAQLHHSANFSINYELATKLIYTDEAAQAVGFLRAAVAVQPKNAVAFVSLGQALEKSVFHSGFVDREWEKPQYVLAAEAAYRKAIEIRPDLAEAHYFLGMVLYAQDKFAESLVACREADRLGPQRPDWQHASALWHRRVERSNAYADMLPRIANGEEKSLSPSAEALVCLGYYHGNARRLNLVASVRAFAAGFAADKRIENELDNADRYVAACHAALACCRKGNDAAKSDDKECAALRRQAYIWLRSDLSAWRTVLDKEPKAARNTVWNTMLYWQNDTDFDGVRTEAALAKLPDTEREEWRQLWEDVENLRKETAPPSGR